jgi:hypothetical protein
MSTDAAKLSHPEILTWCGSVLHQDCRWGLDQKACQSLEDFRVSCTPDDLNHMLAGRSCFPADFPATAHIFDLLHLNTSTLKIVHPRQRCLYLATMSRLSSSHHHKKPTSSWSPPIQVVCWIRNLECLEKHSFSPN